MLMIMEPGDRVPKEHPLRRVKELADAALTQLRRCSMRCTARWAAVIPPERLLKASLLMALYTVARAAVLRQLDYNLLFRWFLDLDVAELSFDHSTFSRNRARLLEHDVAREFFTRVVAVAQVCSCSRMNTSGWMAPGRGVGFAQEFQAQGPGTA